ncbi:MAG: hypothetical protein NC324_10330 [Bacteroides sp.]|nr:hypothetical protein [Bacteroides sp.]
MNKLRLAVLPLFLMFAVCACESDYQDENGTGSNNSGSIENNDEYYVQYVVSSNYPSIFSNVHYASEQGEGSFMNYQTRGWSETIGPVKKGFRAWVKVDRGEPTCKIQVSKNNSAFATKSTGTGSASFTINY